MTLEFDAVYEEAVFKSKTPVDLPKGTTILITQIVDDGNGKPIRLIGHIQREAPDDSEGDKSDAADKE